MTQRLRARLDEALRLIHRDGSKWRMLAEIDPLALSPLVSATATLLGVPSDVAMRIIESELGLRPLARREPVDPRDTLDEG